MNFKKLYQQIKCHNNVIEAEMAEQNKKATTSVYQNKEVNSTGVHLTEIVDGWQHKGGMSIFYTIEILIFSHLDKMWNFN